MNGHADERFGAEFFAPLVGSNFMVDMLAGPVVLRLHACTGLPGGGRYQLMFA